MLSGGYDDTTSFTNTVWNFNLKTQKLDVQKSVKQLGYDAATAFDTENQVGWYYGGTLDTDAGITNLQDLHRLDRGKGAPTKVKTNPSSPGAVSGGELVCFENIGEAGILVLIGGMTSETDIVHVFDIATNTWFTQKTTAQEKYPSGGTKVCSVVASAEDNSSHNIYMYGGTSEILILTLPAFHWILVNPTDCLGGTCDIRQVQGHKCQKVYEKYMVAYRGDDFRNRCDNDPVLKKFQGMTIYDMSSLTWTTKIELENQKYLVPEALYRIIGGK